MCNWVTMLYSRKLTEHCKPAIMEKKSLAKTKKQKEKKQENILFSHVIMHDNVRKKNVYIYV